VNSVGIYASPLLWNQLLYSFNLILFTVLLVHLILRISPHHSHHLRSHHLSLPRPLTPDLKLTCFTNPFLHSHNDFFLPPRISNLYRTKWALAFVLVSSFFKHFFLTTCARLSWTHSAFDATLNSSIVSYLPTLLPQSLGTVQVAFAVAMCPNEGLR